MHRKTREAFKDLQAVCQVAVSIRKVRFQFQGCAVRCNGLWDVSRILTGKKPIPLKIQAREIAKTELVVSDYAQASSACDHTGQTKRVLLTK